MGTKINELFKGTPITLESLKNKTLIVDAYNQLYMFLSSIRQGDGGLLRDSKGNVTSHLSGLYSRFTRLMRHDIKFVFVFDGKPPELKLKERERRANLKKDAELKYEEAKQKEDITAMKKYAQRTTKLTKDMVEEAKKLITALGCPIIQAESEGEAQAAVMVSNGDGYAVMSQDADAFLFGAPRVIKNLTITGRRKRSGSFAYDVITPEIISLSDNLNALGVDREQLVVMSMLTGTDFNIGGIKGIGPKKALQLVQKHKKDFDALFAQAGWEESFPYPWKKVFDIFFSCPISNKYDLTFSTIDAEAIEQLLIEEHEFGRERVEKTIKDLTKKPKEDLTKWFA